MMSSTQVDTVAEKPSPRWWERFRGFKAPRTWYSWTFFALIMVGLMAASFLLGVLSNFSQVHSLTTHLHQQIHALQIQQSKLKAERLRLTLRHTMTPWLEIGGAMLVGFIVGRFRPRPAAPLQSNGTRGDNSETEAPDFSAPPTSHRPHRLWGKLFEVILKAVIFVGLVIVLVTNFQHISQWAMTQLKHITFP